MPNEINYELLAQQLLTQAGIASTQKHTSPASTPNYSYGHGPGGLFSYPGMDRAVFAAMMLPVNGLQARLPVYASTDTHPIYGILTGVTDTTGTEPSGVCDDPPYAGLSKLCMTTVPFGRVSRMTKVFDIDDFGRRVNRGEMFDYQMMNNPMSVDAGLVPTQPGVANAQNLLNNDIAKATFELAVTWARDFARLLYDGSTANNTAGGGYKEPWGLSRLINTGYQDAETESACPSVDSKVLDMNSLQIETNGNEYVKQFSYMARYLKHKAARTGLWPVKWVITMPYAMFYQLTEIWPCAYASYRCSFADATDANARLMVDGMAQTRMRDEMRGDMANLTGQYLLIDGERWEVVLDDAITETGAANGIFTATAWFVPLTVLGSRPVTYVEYFDYRTQGGAIEAAKAFAPDGSFFVSDNGRFLWHKKPPTNWCVQMLAKTQPRFVLRTPYVAGRIQEIAYQPVGAFDSWDVDSEYHLNGGRTAHFTPNLYPPTNANLIRQ